MAIRKIIISFIIGSFLVSVAQAAIFGLGSQCEENAPNKIMDLLLMNDYAYADFPTTGILDTFDRTNEGPPPSASWQGDGNGNGWKVSSFTCIVDSVLAGYAMAEWKTAFGPDMEVYVTLTGKPTVTVGGLYLLVRWDSSTSNGYALDLLNLTGTDNIKINREDGGSDAVLATFSQEFSVGDSVGLSVVGNILTAWYKASGGSWTSLGTYDITSDATKYTTTGRIGILSTDLTSSIDDFGGGTVVAGAVIRTKIIIIQ